MTPHEAKLWVALRKLRPAGFHFRTQVPIGSFVVDFACLQHGLVLEVDGGQHSRNRDSARDLARDEELLGEGFRVRRYWNAEVERDLRSVMDDVVAHLGPASPSPEGRASRAEREPGWGYASGEGASPSVRRSAPATSPSGEGEGGSP